MRIELGIKIEIVVPQPLKSIESLVVIDRREHPADLAKFLPLLRGEEPPVVRQRIDKFGLADGNKSLALLAHMSSDSFITRFARICVGAERFAQLRIDIEHEVHTIPSAG